MWPLHIFAEFVVNAGVTLLGRRYRGQDLPGVQSVAALEGILL